MKRHLIPIAAMATVAVGLSSARAAPVTRDDFLVATTANLVALCSAAETDPLYTPARNFCQGFTVGTYRAISAEEAASRSRRKLFCVPANGPTRDQAIADFVKWASGRPKTLASSPSDGVVEFLAAQFPCR
jgi:Rap1a immunity proteins